MNTGLDQYMDIFKDAVEDSAAKITKSFEKIFIEVIILFMVIPRKINFTQMGRYGSHVEQTYRNAFGLKKSKCIDWLKLNVSLAKRFFGKQGRWAIAIDPSYISKVGKIDMKNLDLTRIEKMEMKNIEGTAYTLIAYSKALKCKVRLVIWQMPNGKKKLFFSTDTSLSGEEYFFNIEPGSRLNFAFVTSKAILVLWTARLAISGNSILLSMLRSHH